MRRQYSTLQVFGIAFSIMGLLPSITTTAATGLEGGPVSFVWGWFAGGFFILCVGISLSFLGSSIPTSGGLFYYANYYSGERVRVPLSFLIGCSNSLALCSGLCSINYGFVSEMFAAIYLGTGFTSTKYEEYGVFVACIISQLFLCSATTRMTAQVQSLSIYINVFIIVLFFIAVPIGTKNNLGGFNDAHFIFGKFENLRTWSNGWSFMLSWMPVIWTIGAFDSCIHMSEECKDPTRKVPIGIVSSISVCWIIGWCICIVLCACIKDGDVSRVIDSDTGMVVAQVIYDSLGKKWAIAFMSLICVAQYMMGKKWAIAFMALICAAQYMMGASILIALSRQVFSFARDEGLPFVYNYVKVINPKIMVPLRATLFSGILSCILALLILINSTAANALFSLAVAGNLLAWGVPMLLVILPTKAAKRFVPGPFYSKTFFYPVNIISCLWVAYVIVMSMFPDSKTVTKDTMNYTCVINGGVWLLSLVYFFVYGYRHYHGPKSNLTSDDTDVYEEESYTHGEKGHMT
ncbi:putative GABA-specific permease [Clavispora lusitaniae]|uniref:GABA-specific permease n=1 Tax=Clavispora lusitaniae TaxID=36911 RepID=A0ACD0WN53_CLALS|nr:putative GABA-specific permease [Clavispora lusitaniae]QFZ34439.1 putative GABA-specific permease [Clavispora lusitaniae]QFZ40123.1 putative GABA-specific permease [Clavispora lusitaniae]QFZ45805.1 putative GABA-specific permease [Clavispora lusitaniae]QFZ51469.1 putative GABA-specific permease [Clavispora lusitaniae]